MGELKFLDMVPGEIVSYNDRLFRLIFVTSITQVVADPLDGGKAEVLPIELLRQPKRETELPPETNSDGDEKPKKKSDKPVRGAKDLQAYSRAEIKEGNRRFKLILPLLKKPDRTQKDVEEVAKAEGVAPSTIYLWMKQFQVAGHASVLIPLPRGVRLGTRSLGKAEEAIVRDVLEKKYLVRRPETIENIIKEIQSLCSKPQKVVAGEPPPKPLKIPHANTIRRRIRAIPIARVLEARGNLEELRKTQPERGHLVSTGPMGLVQIDHWKADIEIVDEVYRLPMSTVWITLAIDVFSRMVVGYYMTPERPTAGSAGMAVAHAMCPKAAYLASLDVKGVWPVWGRIGILHADNGKEFDAKNLSMACDKHTIDHEFRPVKTPNYGGHIERLCGTLAMEIRKWTGAIVDKQSTGAVYTMREFEAQFANLIVNIYHERPHSGIGNLSPRAKWLQGVEGDGMTPGVGIPRVPGDPDTIKIDFMPFVMRPIQTYGVKIKHVNYYSDVLRPFINATVSPKSKEKRKFIFHRADADISRCYWWDEETKQHYLIPPRDLSFPPMSLREYKAVVKFLKGKSIPINETTIAEGRAQMSENDKKATAKTKGAKAARLREDQKRRAAIAAASRPIPPGQRKEPPSVPVPKPGGEDAVLGDIFNQPIERSGGLDVW